ncbi:MAG: hypothetical protein A3H96_08350 [Acidobacteria bacterium RIFCSPLOWO2_02_FULL_67_36]|nr:MAG: hypothetical protein A3H96_08350 [Acidobacteria bacterium RIFCSPLOWO2_02_FULL_67_36]OFW22269.1 MAG: hypothetical protein A3G21_01630 [Acidobacteria bacterium RIFCSPLOWO2_12_FULL_66_21]
MVQTANGPRRRHNRIRHTIPHLVLLAVVLSSVCQGASAQDAGGDPFARGAWRFEAAAHAATEAWNYNVSHEELYGISEGVTYGVREGLQLVVAQRIYYVSQRANDSWLLGLTAGVRKRVYRRGRFSGFVDIQVGISDAAIAAPPRGTRFNYIAIGGGGALWHVRRRLDLLAGLQWIHVSNNSLKGPGRNPDIEALGPSLAMLVRF